MRRLQTPAGIALSLAVGLLVGIANAPAALAQSPSEPPEWQTAAGGHMAFEVNSVKLLRPGSSLRPPNFALDDGDGFKTNSGENPHGRLSVAWSVPVFINFAYKLRLTQDQRRAMLARLPKWAETDLFEIEAKAAGSPTKDQMRLMMQSLLAERFSFAAHYEMQEMPVYALSLIRPGKWGPRLIRHADGPPCDESGRQDRATAQPDPGADVFPPRCEAQTSVPGKNGRIVQGTRNTTMDVLAGFLARTSGRPVVDRTGITDRIDYRLEWTPENVLVTPGVEVEPDSHPLTFLDAVREQLGLKVQSTKSSVRTLVIDRIERPTEN